MQVEGGKDFPRMSYLNVKMSSALVDEWYQAFGQMADMEIISSGGSYLLIFSLQWQLVIKL